MVRRIESNTSASISLVGSLLQDQGLRGSIALAALLLLHKYYMVSIYN